MMTALACVAVAAMAATEPALALQDRPGRPSRDRSNNNPSPTPTPSPSPTPTPGPTPTPTPTTTPTPTPTPTSGRGPGAGGGGGKRGGGGESSDPNGTVAIVKQQDLQFGRVVMMGNGGSVTLPADGLPIYSGLVPAGTTPTPARFEIRGPANQAIRLQLTFPLSGTYGNNGNAMLDGLSVAADYTTAFQQMGTMIVLKLDSSGTNAITVGGKLTLNSATPGKTNILIPVTASIVQ